MHILIYLLALLLAALNVADWRTTRAALISGVGREYNPIMAWLMGKLGMEPVLIAKVVIMASVSWLIAAFYAPLVPWAAIALLAILDAFYVWVVVNNLRVLRQ